MKRGRQGPNTSFEKTKDWSSEELSILKNLILQYATIGQPVPTPVLQDALPSKSTHSVVAKHRAERLRLNMTGECLFNDF